MQKASSLGYQNILALMANSDFMKQYSSYPFTNNYIKEELFSIFKSIKDVNVFAQSMSTILKFINIYVQNIVIFLISYDVIKNKLGITPVVVISVILPIFFNSVNEITRLNISSHEFKSGINFINEELSQEHFEKKIAKTACTRFRQCAGCFFDTVIQLQSICYCFRRLKKKLNCD